MAALQAWLELDQDGRWAGHAVPVGELAERCAELPAPGARCARSRSTQGWSTGR